jgi:MFS family permease
LAALSAGLTAVVLALVQSQSWAAGTITALSVVGLLSLVVFWAIEHRVREPIVEFTLFRNGPYFGASAAAFALVGSYWAVMFFQPQYLQDVPFSGRLIGRFGARRLMSAGMLCGVLGLIVLTRIEADSPYGLLLAGYLLFGIALGLVYAPMSTAAMAAMPGEKVGIASGVLAMDRVLAGAVALAATGAAFHALLGDGDTFAAAVAGSTWVVVVLCAIGAVLTWLFVRDPEQPVEEHSPHRMHHWRFHL